MIESISILTTKTRTVCRLYVTTVTLFYLNFLSCFTYIIRVYFI